MFRSSTVNLTKLFCVTLPNQCTAPARALVPTVTAAGLQEEEAAAIAAAEDLYRRMQAEISPTLQQAGSLVLDSQPYATTRGPGLVVDFAHSPFSISNVSGTSAMTSTTISSKSLTHSYRKRVSAATPGGDIGSRLLLSGSGLHAMYYQTLFDTYLKHIGMPHLNTREHRASKAGVLGDHGSVVALAKLGQLNTRYCSMARPALLSYFSINEEQQQETKNAAAAAAAATSSSSSGSLEENYSTPPPLMKYLPVTFGTVELVKDVHRPLEDGLRMSLLDHNKDPVSSMLLTGPKGEVAKKGGLREVSSATSSQSESQQLPNPNLVAALSRADEEIISQFHYSRQHSSTPPDHANFSSSEAREHMTFLSDDLQKLKIGDTTNFKQRLVFHEDDEQGKGEGNTVVSPWLLEEVLEFVSTKVANAVGFDRSFHPRHTARSSPFAHAMGRSSQVRRSQATLSDAPQLTSGSKKSAGEKELPPLVLVAHNSELAGVLQQNTPTEIVIAEPKVKLSYHHQPWGKSIGRTFVTDDEDEEGAAGERDPWGAAKQSPVLGSPLLRGDPLLSLRLEVRQGMPVGKTVLKGTFHFTPRPLNPSS